MRDRIMDLKDSVNQTFAEGGAKRGMGEDFRERKEHVRLAQCRPYFGPKGGLSDVGWAEPTMCLICLLWAKPTLRDLLHSSANIQICYCKT